MASRASFSDDLRAIKRPVRNSVLLKDHLLDDLSSCSSNGFRSYPRRQCCTAVRFADANKHRKLPAPSQKRQTKPFPKAKAKSVLNRASAALVNAFKHFPFAGSRGKTSFLPRSLSRRLLKWKKTADRHEDDDDYKRVKSFGELIGAKENIPPPLPQPSAAVTTTETHSSSSDSNSWSDSDFTVTSGRYTAGNSSEGSLAPNDAANAGDVLEVNFARNDVVQKNKTTSAETVGVTTPTDTNPNENAKEKWQKEEKEQFSPVSVMDFPCDNDEDEASSTFQHKQNNASGGKQKPTKHKIRRFDNVVHLEPVRLEDRIASSEENRIEKKATALLQLMTATVSSHHHRMLKSETLLLGFFKERIVEGNVSDYEMLQVAKEWMDGRAHETFLDWGSRKNRHEYVKETDKGAKWLKYDDEVGKIEVVSELEFQILTCLLDEILLVGG